MTKSDILDAIRTTAARNAGVPFGQLRFAKETGIRVHEWRGKFWLRWSQALKEAGFAPNSRTVAYDADFILKKLAELTRQLQHVPTYPELLLAKANDETMPGPECINNRVGGKLGRTRKLREFASRNLEYADILPLLAQSDATPPDGMSPSDSTEMEGFVYMLRSGKHYKIGRTTAVPRRHREIALELPEAPSVVHYMRTDDPEGIERYWHQRFAEFRANGEWFALTPKEVRAFKRRRFM